jgi:hypothetical protein
LPPLVSAAPVIEVGLAWVCPAPTWSSVPAGTEVSWPMTEVRALPVGGAAVLPEVDPEEPPFERA